MIEVFLKLAKAPEFLQNLIGALRKQVIIIHIKSPRTLVWGGGLEVVGRCRKGKVGLRNILCKILCKDCVSSGISDETERGRRHVKKCYLKISTTNRPRTFRWAVGSPRLISSRNARSESDSRLLLCGFAFSQGLLGSLRHMRRYPGTSLGHYPRLLKLLINGMNLLFRFLSYDLP